LPTIRRLLMRERCLLLRGSKMMPKSVVTRGMYVAFFFLAAVAMYIFNFWAYKILNFIPVLDLCQHDNQWCVGVLATARVAFGMTVFHGLMALLMIRVHNSSDFRASIQDGWWFFKFLAILGLTVAAFFIPNEFFVVFGWICLFGAGGFIMVQLVYLIEFGYTWAESWLSKYEGEAGEENRSYYWLLLIATALLYGLALTATILLYVFFYNGPECWMNATFPTINILVCALFSLASIHSRIQASHPNRGTGLLQSGVVTLYCTYLVYSAVSSEPNSGSFQCNPFDDVGGSVSSVLTGAAFTIIAVCWSTIRMSTKGNDLLQGGTGADSSIQAAEEGDKLLPQLNEENIPGSNAHSGGEEEHEGNVEDDEKDEVTYNYSFFHITFMLGVMYVFMLMTDWQTVSGVSHTDNYKVDHGFTAVWVKLATSWLAALLYIWTLIEPVVLPGRDWS
jgi:hypothetical protein